MGARRVRAFKNLREFLQLLDTEKQLLRIHDEVNLEPDLAGAGRAITQLSEASPALHFDRIKGYDKAQVVLNVHGSWTNLALMLGMEKDASLREQFFEFVRRYEQFPGTIEHHDSAPWQAVVVDKDVNMFELMPVFRFNRGDGGFFIDKACIISRDPDDWNNEDLETVGIYRLQVKGKNRLGIQPVPVHDIAIHLDPAEQRGQDLAIAIAVGNEPIIPVAAGMSVPYGQSKYKMAAVIQGKPYPVVRTGKGLNVPWGGGIRAGGSHPCSPARARRPVWRVSRSVLRGPQLSGDRDRARFALQGPDLRGALSRRAVDGDGLS